MELVIVRHAEPVRIVDADGPADPPLTERGLLQAKAVAEWLGAEQIDALYSSPLRRAIQTAQPIAAACGLEMVLDDDVAEYDRHNTSYIPYEELKRARDPQFLALVENRLEEYATEGAAWRDSVIAAMGRIIAAHPGQRVAVVCHGGVVNVFAANVLDLERELFFEPEYTSITRVAASRQGVRSIASLNETAHLRNLQA